MAESSVSIDEPAWRKLFSLDGRATDDLEVLASQFGRWADRRGIAAALYTTDNGEAERRLQVGAAPFPRRVESEAGEDSLTGSVRVDLPGAVLLHTGVDGGQGDATVDPHDAELLLIAAGLRICGLKRQIQEQSFQAKYRGVELEALYEVGLAIASTLDLEELAEEVLLRAISLLDARVGALYFLEEDVYSLQRSLGGAAREELAADEPGLAEFLRGNGNAPGDLLPGTRHLLGVPVEVEGDPRGLLVVADKESRRGIGPFPSTDRRTLSLFANQAAIAIENAKLHKLALDKERLEREMELAAEIQQRLLPKHMPVIPGFEVVGWNRPARQVGGDYFDLPGLGNGHLGLVVGDVTGKGMPAALLVSTLHSALRVLLDRMEVGPELLERLNRHIYESSASNKFITMLLATVDLKTNRLVYINAGHNPGLLLHKNGEEAVQLASAGLPLGLLPQGQYGSAYLDLEEGDLLCIYSDGITECESPAEEEFGLERLIDLLRENHKRPLQEIMDAIDRVTTDFAAGMPQGDDQTVILLRRIDTHP